VICLSYRGLRECPEAIWMDVIEFGVVVYSALSPSGVPMRRRLQDIRAWLAYFESCFDCYAVVLLGPSAPPPPSSSSSSSSSSPSSPTS
jgi:hypothetical protein